LAHRVEEQKQLQILRLRLAQRARQTPLRMTASWGLFDSLRSLRMTAERRIKIAESKKGESRSFLPLRESTSACD
jgi:hypothetical protein